MLIEVTSAPKGRVLPGKTKTLVSIHVKSTAIRSFALLAGGVVGLAVVIGIARRGLEGAALLDAPDMILQVLFGLFFFMIMPTMILAIHFALGRVVRKEVNAEIIDAMERDVAQGAVVAPLTQFIGVSKDGANGELKAQLHEQPPQQMAGAMNGAVLDMDDPEVRAAVSVLMRVTGAQMPGEAPSQKPSEKTLH